MSDRGLPDFRRGDLYALIVTLLATVAVAAFKLKLIAGWPGPSIFGDELLYRLYAQRIHDWQSYDLAMHWVEPAYPPLYPLLLSFGLYASNWYHAMLVLNILAMATAPLLIYAITRWFAGRAAATGAAVAAAVVPSGIIPSPFLVAESLAVPAFVFAVYASLAPRNASPARALLAGGAMAGMYLVKYVLLVFLPPLSLGFLLMQLALTSHLAWPKRILTVLIRCTIVALGFAIALAAWLLYAHWWGLPVINSLGFWNTGSVSPPTPAGLRFYFTLLMLAALLGVAPLLGLMLAYRPKSQAEWAYAIVVVVTLLLSVCFLAWFCWRSDFQFSGNKPFDIASPKVPLPMRYISYWTWLALPIAFIAAERAASASWSRRIVASVTAAAVAVIAIGILIVGWIWPTAPPLLGQHAPDTWPYATLDFLGHVPLPAIALAAGPAVLLLVRPLWTGWRGVLAASLPAVAVLACLDFAASRHLFSNATAAIGRNMSAVLYTSKAEGDGTLVVVDRARTVNGPDDYAAAAMFWLTKPPIVVGGSAALNADGKLVVTYEWPKNRLVYWVEKKMPDVVPTFVMLLSSGSPPPQSYILAPTGEPGKSYFLVHIPPEQVRRAAPSP